MRFTPDEWYYRETYCNKILKQSCDDFFWQSQLERIGAKPRDFEQKIIKQKLGSIQWLRDSQPTISSGLWRTSRYNTDGWRCKNKNKILMVQIPTRIGKFSLMSRGLCELLFGDPCFAAIYVWAARWGWQIGVNFILQLLDHKDFLNPNLFSMSRKYFLSSLTTSN